MNQPHEAARSRRAGAVALITVFLVATLAGVSAVTLGRAGEGRQAPAIAAQSTATACPVARATCRFAGAVTQWLQQKRFDLFIAAWQGDGFICPFPRKPGLGGPYPLCEDVTTKGVIRMGYSLGHWESEGGWQSGTDLEEAFTSWVEGADPGLEDQYGDGRLRRFTIGCPKGTAPADCTTDFVVVFSWIDGGGTEPSRAAQILHVTSDGKAVNSRTVDRLSAGGPHMPSVWFEGGSDHTYTYYPWGN